MCIVQLWKTFHCSECLWVCVYVRAKIVKPCRVYAVQDYKMNEEMLKEMVESQIPPSQDVQEWFLQYFKVSTA